MPSRRFPLTVVTDGAGAATVFSPVLSGSITAIHYIKTDYATGVDFTITADKTGETIWAENNVDANATRAPRFATSTTGGVAALYAAAGLAVNAMIHLSNDRVKIVIAAGGASKTGLFHIVVEEGLSVPRTRP